MILPDALIRDISPLDTMLDNGEDAYFAIGQGALTLCKRIHGDRLPRRIIDFPSGFGRALRWFRHEWPDEEIYAVETDGNALQFVEKTFNAVAIPGDPNLKTSLPADTDLIFCGSLLTHFDDWQWDAFLEICSRSLAPEGTLVFTTHGRAAALQARNNNQLYGT